MAMYKEFFKKSFVIFRAQTRALCSVVKDQPYSSLYISGKRAQDTFVVVVPHLDFDEQFVNENILRENLKRRKLNFDVDQLKSSWIFFKDWEDKKNKLQNNLDEIGKRIKGLLKCKENGVKNEIEILERQRDVIKSELHEVKVNVWGIEDKVIGKLLNLPNYLHPQVPDVEEEMFLYDEENVIQGSNHLIVGEKLNLIEYYDQYNFFLKDETAIFELAASDFFANHFLKKGFIQFSNPDFTRSALAEGVGVLPNEISDLFLLENTEGNNDRLHLCGGASLFPFCGFHAKQVVQKEDLPVKYITSGRHYSPSPSSLPGLYSVHQSTSVQFFIATWNGEEMYNEFQSCLESLQAVFSELKLKFRIVKQPPFSYKNCESLRVSIQIFSPFHEFYIEVGHMNLIDDYISKRLRMCYSDKKGEMFLKVISGTVINTQTLLALCLERSQETLFVPKVLKKYSLF